MDAPWLSTKSNRRRHFKTSQGFRHDSNKKWYAVLTAALYSTGLPSFSLKSSKEQQKLMLELLREVKMGLLTEFPAESLQDWEVRESSRNRGRSNGD